MIASIARSLACVFLALFCSVTFAQSDQSLTIVAGDSGTRLAGQQYRTIVELLSEDEAVAGERLYLSTTFGELAANLAVTDSKGDAPIIVNSDTEGTGEVTVRTKLGTTLRYPVEFDSPLAAQLLLTSSFSRVFSPDDVTISVQLVDENLDAIEGETISLFVANPTDGTLSNSDIDTNADGEASTNLAISDGLPSGTQIKIAGEVASSPGTDAELLISVVADSADDLQFSQPGNATRVQLNEIQQVAVVWRRGFVPIANQTVNFATTHGTFSTANAVTDAAGIARTTIQATEVGIGILTASIAGTTSDPISITFADFVAADDRYNTGGSDIPLEIFKDRIGIQARPGVTGDEVLALANEENLTILRTLTSRLFEFDLGSEMSRDALQALARRLEGQYGDIVRTAGLVAQRVGGTRPALMANKIRARFVGTLNDGDIDLLKASLPIDDIRLARYSTRYYEILLSDDAAWDVVAIADQVRLQTIAPVKFAYPALTMAVQSRAICSSTTTVIDPRFADQWHHDNPGNGDALPDADIDSVEAWEFTTGNISNPLVAVIDSSFPLDHCEFIDGTMNKDNLWSGFDPDGNVIRGRDFVDGDDDLLLDPPLYSLHGAAVGGVLGAVEGNHWGGRGVCYHCKMLLMTRQDQVDATRAFEFAIDNSVRIINNSWGLDSDLPDPELNDVIAEAATDGIVVLFATPNENEDSCASLIDINNGNVTELSSFPHVIAVSASTDEDLRTYSGHGDCINVLGPTRGGENGVTTAGMEPALIGYHNTLIDDFGGTSAATPMVAGIAGLLLDLDPTLVQDQIRRILQDTADKIDPENAKYDAESGYSTLPDDVPNFAFGRVNAYEAVSLIAAYDAAETAYKKRGKAGKDLLLRDHPFDWGNTEQPSSVLFTNPRTEKSVWNDADIKLDVEPFQTVEASLAGYLSLQSEKPQQNKRTRVLVRVRNRGPLTVSNAVLKLHWTLQSNPLPPLAADFWSVFPQDSNLPGKEWTSAGLVTLNDVEYSGASAAGCPGRAAPLCLPLSAPVTDLAQVAEFSLPALDWDSGAGEHLSLFITAHSDEDPLLARTGVVVTENLFDVIVAASMDNNVSLWEDLADGGGGGGNGCDGTVITIIIILYVLIAILIAIIIYCWIFGIRVPRAIYITLLILLAILIIIVIKVPGCAVEAFETLKNSMGL